MVAWFLSHKYKISFMKREVKRVRGFLQVLVALISSFIVSVVTFAQDKQVDINVNTNKGNNFWGSPWVWVIGAAVFILLLVAILRGGGRREA
jgi:hypothetical protein